MPQLQHPGSFIIILLFFLQINTNAQENKLNFGTEQDVLPWVTGGYYAGIWAGMGHVRARTLIAHVHKPSFITPDGFHKNEVTAYALVGEYFLNPGWEGLSVSSGLVYWKSSVQRKGYTTTAKYENVLLHGSLSWAIRLSKHFYVTPWVGLHLRLGGAKTVSVDGGSFKTPLISPEASLKAGFWF